MTNITKHSTITTLRIPDDVLAAAKTRAAAESRSLAGQIIHYMRQGLARDGDTTPANPSAPAPIAQPIRPPAQPRTAIANVLQRATPPRYEIQPPARTIEQQVDALLAGQPE